jgi:hypothetical protein
MYYINLLQKPFQLAELCWRALSLRWIVEMTVRVVTIRRV